MIVRSSYGKLPQYAGSKTELHWEMDGHCALAVITANDEQCEKLKDMKNFGFCFVSLEGAIIFGIKEERLEQINTGGWMAAPFFPHTVSGTFEEFPEGDGMPLTIMLVNSTDGQIVKIHTMNLGNEFSNAIIQAVQKILEKPFDMLKYKMSLYDLVDMYPSDELLAENAENKFEYEK